MGWKRVERNVGGAFSSVLRLRAIGPFMGRYSGT
jgi:hypothetical protein